MCFIYRFCYSVPAKLNLLKFHPLIRTLEGRIKHYHSKKKNFFYTDFYHCQPSFTFKTIELPVQKNQCLIYSGQNLKFSASLDENMKTIPQGNISY